ncbi:MAG: cation diffusion facilitator family transporter [Anaerolineaceae bacterium]|jgi:cobalt-zinc-cadmium efflux system protein
MHTHINSAIEKRFVISIVLTVLILVAEVIGGFWTVSLALLSDAAHVFMDVFALALSYLALRLSGLPADDRHTYGYHRLEVLAALFNGVSLLAIAVGIFWEAYQRWQAPVRVHSVELLVIASLGLAVNLVVAFVLGRHSSGAEHVKEKEDLNLHSAYLHVIGDAISSVGVILAAVVITLTGREWMDTLVSVLIGGLILFSSYRMMRSSLHILIEGVPVGMSIQDVAEVISHVPGVQEVHDLHVWSICSGNVALSAHLVLNDVGLQGTRAMMTEVKQQLMSNFAIEHTTIQLDEEDCLQGEQNYGGVREVS